MRITSVRLKGYRAFEDSGEIELGPVTVFIGPNNAGKSSLIRALHLLQSGGKFGPDDLRGGGKAEVHLSVSGLSNGSLPPNWRRSTEVGNLLVELAAAGASYSLRLVGGNANPQGFSPAPSQEPSHVIVPFLASRRSGVYQEGVGKANAETVDGSFQWLAAKLARLANPAFPAYEKYSAACKEILGVVVASVPATNGLVPGQYLTDGSTISIQNMGDGVPHIVGLLVDLALYHGKIFLIEELEDSLHPRALKALLDLVIESSSDNQFVVATHSNIVMRYLASLRESRLYYVDSDHDASIPTASVREIPLDAGERMAVLRDLGYESADLGVWDAWLFLEESSAERVIRECLIPWFAPSLAHRIRTVAAGGVSKVEPTFEDFHRLMLFTHLQPGYRGRAWVVLDGDQQGRQVVAQLKERYKTTWDAAHFRTFSEANFESYYPPRFAEEVEAALSEKDKDAKREAKRTLLVAVLSWANLDQAAAKTEFEQSASEVVGILAELEENLRDSK